MHMCVALSVLSDTLGFLCSALGSDTRAWFSRNGFRHSWGRVLRFMTSCALVRLFGAGRSLGWSADTLNWCVVGSHCRNITSLMRWCPCTLVTLRAEDTRWEKQGLRSSRGHWRPRQRPRLDEPASPTGSWNSSFSVTHFALFYFRLVVVRSNKVARKRLTKSNGTPAIDLEYEYILMYTFVYCFEVVIRIRRYINKRGTFFLGFQDPT